MESNQIKHIINEEYLKLNESIYDFHQIPVEVTQENYDEALMLRNKYTLFKDIGIGTFLTTTLLWRCIDEKEYGLIFKTNKITGGDYAVPAEKYMGASFSGSRQDVIDWGIRVKTNGRLKGQLYIIGINAVDKEFLSLTMVERLTKQGLKYEVGDFTVDGSLGNTGIGFSVRNVTLDDVRFIYELNDQTKELNDITFDVL